MASSLNGTLNNNTKTIFNEKHVYKNQVNQCCQVHNIFYYHFNNLHNINMMSDKFRLKMEQQKVVL